MSTPAPPVAPPPWSPPPGLVTPSRPRRRVPVGWIIVVIAFGLPGVLFGGLVYGSALDNVRHGASPLAATTDPEQARDTAIKADLSALTTSYAAGNPSAYAAVFAHLPTASRSRQATTFAAMRSVPGLQITYRWTDGWNTPPGLAARYHTQDAGVAQVLRQYWIKGWDKAPIAEPLAFTFARTGRTWTLVGDTDTTIATTDDEPEPWAVGQVAVVSTPHVLMIGDPGARATLKRVGGYVEDSIATVRTQWPFPSWNGKVVVYAVTSPSFTHAWFGGVGVDGVDDGGSGAEFDAEVVPLRSAAAVTSTAAVQDDEHPAALRMVLSPAMLKQPASQVRTTMRHELTHVATGDLGAEAPTWVAEGAAEYTAFRVAGSGGRVDGVESLNKRGLPKSMWTTLRRSSYRPDLYAPSDGFYAGSQTTVGVRYSESWLAVMYIAQTYGDATLRAFYQAACDPKQPTQDDREVAALRSVLHLDKPAFEQKVGSYARGLRRHFV